MTSTTYYQPQHCETDTQLLQYSWTNEPSKERDTDPVTSTSFGVGVSCRNLYSFVFYLYENGSGSITSVGEERANLSAVVYL